MSKQWQKWNNYERFSNAIVRGAHGYDRDGTKRRRAIFNWNNSCAINAFELNMNRVCATFYKKKSSGEETVFNYSLLAQKYMTATGKLNDLLQENRNNLLLRRK